MLDRYLLSYGFALSPERQYRYRFGAQTNAVGGREMLCGKHSAVLCAKVEAFGVLGMNEPGRSLRDVLVTPALGRRSPRRSAGASTTVKTRSSRATTGVARRHERPSGRPAGQLKHKNINFLQFLWPGAKRLERAGACPIQQLADHRRFCRSVLSAAHH